MLLGGASLAALPAPVRAAENFEIRERAPIRYDADYPVVDYSGSAMRNRVWYLQQQLESGAKQLAWQTRGGYLDSLLKALSTEADSYVLVFTRSLGRATHGDEIVPFEETVIEGNRLQWTQHLTKPLRLAVRFDVRVDGDTMNGTAKASVFPLSNLTGVRDRETPRSS